MHAWSYARTQRELSLCNGLMCMVGICHSSISWSCGHACGFVVARRFFRAPRNALWSCVAMTLRSLGAWRAHGALGVMALYKTGWANL